MTVISPEVIGRHIKSGEFVALRLTNGALYGRLIEADQTCYVVSPADADHIGISIVDAECVVGIYTGPMAEAMFERSNNLTSGDDMRPHIAEAVRQHKLRQEMAG